MNVSIMGSFADLRRTLPLLPVTLALGAALRPATAVAQPSPPPVVLNLISELNSPPVLDGIAQNLPEEVSRTSPVRVALVPWEKVPHRGPDPGRHHDLDLLVRVRFDIHVNTPAFCLAVDGDIEYYLFPFLEVDGSIGVNVEGWDYHTSFGSICRGGVDDRLKADVPRAATMVQDLIEHQLTPLASERFVHLAFWPPWSGSINEDAPVLAVLFRTNSSAEIDTPSGSVAIVPPPFLPTAWHTAQGEPNGGFGGWSGLGDARGGLRRMVVGRNADGRLSVFAIDTASGRAWHTAQVTPNGDFGGWSRLGDLRDFGQIAVGRNADGRLSVFAVDTPLGFAWHTAQSAPNGGFGDWSRVLDRARLGQIAVGSNADGRLSVFAVDTAAGLAWHTAQAAPNGGFGGWSRLFSAAGLGEIAVDSNADGRLSVFARSR